MTTTNSTDKAPIVEVSSDTTTPNLTDIIVPIASKLLPSIKQQRGLDVLLYRFGLKDQRIYTLEEVGIIYGITREAVRQLEEKALRGLYDFLLDLTPLKSSQFYIPPVVTNEVTALRTAIHSIGPLVLEAEVVQLLLERYQITIQHIDMASVRILLRLFGYKLIARKKAGFVGTFEATWATNAIDKMHLYQVVKLEYYALSASAIPLSFIALKIEINKKRKDRIDDTYIRLAAKVCHEIEEIDVDLFQLAFVKLSSHADKAYRIIFNAGGQLHAKEITRKINHLLAQGGYTPDAYRKSVTNQLVSDKRFAPIGRSGTWALAERKDINRETILSTMMQYFHLSQSKQTVDAVFQYVITKRPDASYNSVSMYLMLNSKFTKVTQTEYELASWGSKPYSVATTKTNPVVSPRNRIRKFQNAINISQVAIVEFLKNQPGQRAKVADVIKYVLANTSCKNRVAIYSHLSRIPSVVKEGSGKNKWCFLKTSTTNALPISSALPVAAVGSVDWLEKMIPLKEGLKLDFKREYKLTAPQNPLPDKQTWQKFIDGQWNEFIKDIIALTNGNVGTARQSGFIIIGVGDTLHADNTRDIYDTSDFQINEQTILNKVNAACHPPMANIICHSILLQGKKITVIELPPSPYVHETTKQLEIFKASFDNTGAIVHIRSEKTYTTSIAFIRRGEDTHPATHAERNALERERSGIF